MIDFIIAIMNWHHYDANHDNITDDRAEAKRRKNCRKDKDLLKKPNSRVRKRKRPSWAGGSEGARSSSSLLLWCSAAAGIMSAFVSDDS